MSGMRNVWEIDGRRNFVEMFLRFKRATNDLPCPLDTQRQYDTLVQFLMDFDAKRNEANIALEEAFKQHMNICLKPILLVRFGEPNYGEKS